MRCQRCSSRVAAWLASLDSRFVAHLGTIRVWDAMMGKGDVPIAGGGRAHHVEARGFWEGVSRKLDVIERAFDRDIVEARIAAACPGRLASVRTANAGALGTQSSIFLV